MTVVDIPHASVDLAPGLPSRVVYGTVLAPTEDRGVKGGWIDFSIPGEIKIPGQETTITGRAARVPLNVDGTFAVRLPVAAEGIEPEDWALSVKMSWRPVPFPMRVPTGQDPIWIEDCDFPELVPGEDPSKYFLSGAVIRSVNTVDPDQDAAARGEIIAGVWTVDLDLPRGRNGLPGANAIPTDEAVAAYVTAEDGSATGDALRAEFASRARSATASATTIDYWVSPAGSDTGSGSSAAPFRTLAKAVSMIPDLVRVDHVYTINLEPGVWDEILELNHRLVYGRIIIQGTTEDREAHKVLRVRADSILGYLTVQNVTTTVKNAMGQSFRFRRCAPFVEVLNCKAESNPSIERGVEGVIGLLADYGSQVMVRGCDFGGKRYGMRSNYLSRIFSHNNTGSNSTFGLGARWGGIMSIYGTQPTGDTDRTNSSSGIIAFEHGGKLGLPNEPGIVSALGNGDAAPTVKRYQLNSSTTGINGDIRDGATIRARFRAPNDGYVFFRVGYGGQTSVSAAQGIERNLYGFVTRTGFLTSGATTVSNNNFGSRPLELVHTGSDGVIDLRLEPLVALAGRWAIDVEMTYHRGLSGPVLQSVALV